MKLENQYQSILDASFRNNFPEWDEMSPLDPMKVLAESLSGSLAEIEKRQSRFTNTVLDCLPALFSFEPRKACLPVGLFQVTPSNKLTHSQRIGPEAVFRFESDSETILVSPESSQDVTPVFDFKATHSASGYKLRFRQTDGTQGIQLDYIPGESPDKIRNIRVRIQDGGNEHEFCREDLLLVDRTHGLSSLGPILLQPVEGVFAKEAMDVEVEIDLEAPPKGSLHVNLIQCVYFKQEEYVELGELTGEPWEEVALSTDLTSPPAELHIHFPDDHTLRIRRIDSDILKLHHSNYERFSNSFFYNAVNHSLVLPSAHRLVKQYAGGVTLLAPRTQKAPSTDWIGSDFEGNVGEYSTLIESVTPIHPLRAYSPRESKVDYLRRFYGAIRTFTSSAPKDRDFIPEQFKAGAIALDERVHTVELAIDSEAKSVTIFALTSYPSSGQALFIEPEIREKLAEYATETIPLDYDWTIQPFSISEPVIQLSTQIQLDGSRMGLIGKDVLHEKIVSKLSHILLPPPFGYMLPGNKYSKEALLNELLKRLTAPQGDNSHLRRTEVKSLHGLIVHGDSSRFISSLARPAGKILYPRIEVASRIGCVDGLTESLTIDEPEIAHA